MEGGRWRDFVAIGILACVVLVSSSAMAQTLDSRFRPQDFSALCKDVYFPPGFHPRWTETEKRLVCGDPTPDALGRPWSEIPPSQARFLLRTFLEARGYHAPEFSIEGEALYVLPGPQTRASRLEFIQPPPHWRIPRKRGVSGTPLTPALLDELEGWTLNQIKTAGYACGDVGALADPDTGLIRLEIKSDDRKRILDVLDVTETNLYPGVLDRYSAYSIGEFYSERLVELTRRRLLEDGVLLAVGFSTACYPNGVILRRDPLLGPPREFRIGIGGNTDDGFRLRTRAKRLRWGPAASSVEANLDASFRQQTARLLGRWYYSTTSTRDFVEPSIRFERINDPAIASRTWQISTLHGWNRELEAGNAEVQLGPSWQISAIDEGIGPEESTIVFLEGSLRWQSHASEYFAQSPREGSRFKFDLVQTQRDWGAPFTASRGHILGQALWNLLRYDPPLVVFGLRYSLGTTWTERDLDATALPVRFRFFAGGTEDLRGFDRSTLPRNSNGGLTEALIGAEIRAYRILFRRLDPFVFLDAGRMGARAVRLDPALYWSPGVGTRWESPVGTFRAFVARGDVHNAPPGFPGPFERWRIGLSYGEEF